MKFRQNGILFWEVQVAVIICLIGCVFLMVYDGIFITILLLPSACLLTMCILPLILDQVYITMDEEGISCLKGKSLHWRYKWSEIDELKIGNRFRNPSVEIVFKSDCCKAGSRIETSETYFQLGFSAKKAMRKYYKKSTSSTRDGSKPLKKWAF